MTRTHTVSLIPSAQFMSNRKACLKKINKEDFYTAFIHWILSSNSEKKPSIELPLSICQSIFLNYILPVTFKQSPALENYFLGMNSINNSYRILRKNRDYSEMLIQTACLSTQYRHHARVLYQKLTENGFECGNETMTLLAFSCLYQKAPQSIAFIEKYLANRDHLHATIEFILIQLSHLFHTKLVSSSTVDTLTLLYYSAQEEHPDIATLLVLTILAIQPRNTEFLHKFFIDIIDTRDSEIIYNYTKFISKSALESSEIFLKNIS